MHSNSTRDILLIRVLTHRSVMPQQTTSTYDKSASASAETCFHFRPLRTWSGVSSSDGLPFFLCMYPLDVPEEALRKASTCRRKEVDAIGAPPHCTWAGEHRGCRRGDAREYAAWGEIMRPASGNVRSRHRCNVPRHLRGKNDHQMGSASDIYRVTVAGLACFLAGEGMSEA